MFGGHGVFESDAMFVLVNSEGELFLRADDETVERYEAAGCSRHGKTPYWSPPADVLASDELLREWATEALEAARRAK